MSVYIQTTEKLKKISGDKLTKDKISSALGYSPIDEDDVNAKIASHSKDTTVHVTPTDRATWGDYNQLKNLPDILDDNSGKLEIADSNGNVALRVDEEGITHVVALTVDGQDLEPVLNDLQSHTVREDLHVSTDDRTRWDEKSNFSGNYTDLVGEPNIMEDDTHKLEVADTVGNVILRVDDEGMHTTSVEIVNGDVTLNVEDKFTELTNTFTKYTETTVFEEHSKNDSIHIGEGEREYWSAKAEASTVKTLNTDLNDHMEDIDFHVSPSDRSKWDDKSDFSGDYHDLENKPNILEDSSDTFNVVDSEGNIIFRIDETGVHATSVTIKKITEETPNPSPLVVEDEFDSLYDEINKHRGEITHLGADEREHWNEAYEHISNTGNVHNLTTADLKLENVDNTSDMDKPVSTLQREAIDEVQDFADGVNAELKSHLGDEESHVSTEDRTKWNDKSYLSLTDKPNITEDETGNLIIADKQGNKIFQVDENGLSTTNIDAQNIILTDGHTTLDVFTDLIDVTDTANVAKSTIDSHTGESNALSHVSPTDRENWDSKTSFDGNYNSLTNLPDIDGDIDGAISAHAQLNIHVTTDDRERWDNKSNFSGKYEDLTGLPDLEEEVNEHASRQDLHIQSGEREYWNSKSEFTGNYSDLIGKPNIVEDESNDNEFSIVDNEGNITLKVDREGTTHIADLVVTGQITNDEFTYTKEEVESVKGSVDELEQQTTLQEAISVNLGENVTIGGYKTGDVITAGTALQNILNKLFQKAVLATYTSPQITLSAQSTAAGNYEYGTTITAQVEATFTQNDAGAIQSIGIQKNGVEVITATENSLTSVAETIQLTSSVTYIATAEYAEGAIKNNNLEEASPEGHIVAGSVTSSEVKFTPYRSGYFYGVLATDSATTPLTSAIIRSGTRKDGAYSSGNLPLISASSVANRKRIFVACPATNKGVTKVIMPSAVNADCTANFVKQTSTVMVEGAEASEGIAYNVWVYEPAEISDDQTFTVTLG